VKRLTFAAFAAFWAFVAALLALSKVAPEPAVGRAADATVGAGRITLAEVAEHDTAQSCWLAIGGNVYDVTAYLESHPAPPAVLLAWCGREATEAMRTKGLGRGHSEAAWASLAPLRVGELE
jgi:cytochrome b involved in lipid metabolism